MICCMQSNDKLDGMNYDIWHLKVQLALNDGDMLDLLTSSMPTLVEKDEQGRDIIATEQYQENLKVYQAWFKCDHFTCYTILSCT